MAKLFAPMWRATDKQALPPLHTGSPITQVPASGRPVVGLLRLAAAPTPTASLARTPALSTMTAKLTRESLWSVHIVAVLRKHEGTLTALEGSTVALPAKSVTARVAEYVDCACRGASTGIQGMWLLFRGMEEDSSVLWATR